MCFVAFDPCSTLPDAVEDWRASSLPLRVAHPTADGQSRKRSQRQRRSQFQLRRSRIVSNLTFAASFIQCSAESIQFLFVLRIVVSKLELRCFGLRQELTRVPAATAHTKVKFDRAQLRTLIMPQHDVIHACYLRQSRHPLGIIEQTYSNTSNAISRYHISTNNALHAHRTESKSNENVIV